MGKNIFHCVPFYNFCCLLGHICPHYLLFIGQINNAGTNKGFRPLLEFTEEDIKQVKSL